jgi:hypothetical protein
LRWIWCKKNTFSGIVAQGFCRAQAAWDPKPKELVSDEEKCPDSDKERNELTRRVNRVDVRYFVPSNGRLGGSDAKDVNEDVAEAEDEVAH